MIRRATVGRSLPGDHGAEFPYTAVIEFDNETDLRAYIAIRCISRSRGCFGKRARRRRS